MGSDVSQSTYRGLLIPYEFVNADNLDAASSSYNQAGPLPGVPEPQDDSDLTLQATGTQSASKQLRIRANRGGLPQPRGGGGFVWQYQGDALHRGYDAPAALSAWEAVEWLDTSAYTRDPHAITLADGKVLVVVQDYDTTNYRVRCYLRSTAGVWTESTVYSQLTAPAFGYQATALQLPSGRVLCFFWLDDGSGARHQVAQYLSDDDGATWSKGQGDCLLDAIDTASSPGSTNTGGDPARLRAAYHGGEILLVAQERIHNTHASVVYRDRFLQYASDDLGASFRLVDSWPDSVFGNYQDIVVTPAGFLFVYIKPTLASGTNGTVASRLIGSASDVIRSAAENTSAGYDIVNMTGTPAYADAGDLTAWRDEDGIIFAAFRADIGRTSLGIIKSEDGGDTWIGVGSNTVYTSGGATSGSDTAIWYDQATAGTYPKNLTGTSQGGRSIILHNWAANPGDEDNSLGAAYLGGYSTVTLPKHSHAVTGTLPVSWARTFLPFDLPSVVGWTGTGAAVDTLAGGYYQINAGISSRRFNSQVPVGTVAEGIIARAALEVVSGGSLTLNACALQLRMADGSADYQVTIRFLTTGFRVYDDNAAAAVGSDVVVDMTAGVDVLASMNNGNFALWYRLRSTSGDREWIAGPTSTGLTNDSGDSATNQITWGTLVNHNTTSRWYEVHHVTDEWAGGSLATGQTNPTDLQARTFSASGTWVDDGVSIQAIDGPAAIGQVWNIDTRYTYPVGRIYPRSSPSPREKWRSTDETQQQIAWKFSEAWPTGVSMGIYLDGINWRLGAIEYWDGAAWQSSVTLDAATDRTALPFTRTDGLVIPSGTAHTAEHYIERNELQGATVDLGSSKFRKVVSNTAGLWTNAATKKPALHLTGQEAGDPGSGTCNIWAPRVLAIQHKLPATVQGIRLTINAQTTADGYFTLGAFVVAPVVIFGNDTSWGRALTMTPNVEVATSRDGARRAQKLGPDRRSVEFAWADGIDAMHVQGDTPDPDHLSLDSTAIPLALRGEAMLPRDLVSSIDGPAHPLVYLPSVSGPGNYNEIRRQEFLYGRIMGGVRMEQIQGEEGEDEVFRIATIMVEEEL